VFTSLVKFSKENDVEINVIDVIDVNFDLFVFNFLTE